MNRTYRRLFICAAAMFAVFSSFMVRAADYPAGPIKLINPFPPGGATDLAGRLLATHLTNEWKQTVVVESRAGGNGMIGPTAVARSKPDGYTLLIASPSLATAAATVKDMPIDPVKELDGVSQLVETDFIIAINPSLPAKTLREFIALAKASPGKLNYGSYAAGARLSTEYFKSLAGIDLTHVGYKGEALTIQALAANEVQLVIATSVTLKEPAAKNAVRALAVSGPRRSASMPDIPTSAEAGLPAFNQMVWFGVFAPAGTPAEIKNKLSAEIANFLKQRDVIDRLHSMGLEPKGSKPDELSAFLQNEIRIAVETGKKAGIEPQ